MAVLRWDPATFLVKRKGRRIGEITGMEEKIKMKDLEKAERGKLER